MKRQRNSFLTPLIVEVMPSGKKFKLFKPFTYVWKNLKITVPANFETDFASIPRSLRFIIEKLGRWNKDSVIHDWLYQQHTIQVSENVFYTFSRKMADLCFRDGMRDRGVANWKCALMYRAVRLCGGSAWNKRR